jgi:protein phosphatase
MAQAMIDAGAMTREAAEQSHWKHVLISALGSPQIEPEIMVLDIERGGMMMLCTDGLTRHISDDEISQRLAKGGAAETICRDLIDMALERGGVDNVTVLLSKAPD